MRSQETTGADAFEATRDGGAPERGVLAQRNWGKNIKKKNLDWKSASVPTKGVDMFTLPLYDLWGWVAVD